MRLPQQDIWRAVQAMPYQAAKGKPCRAGEGEAKEPDYHCTEEPLMAREWKAVKDVKAFLAEKGKRSVGVHRFEHLKRIHWAVCCRCGLVALRNAATRKAMKAACEVWE
jgi:hypothetical protein